MQILRVAARNYAAFEWIHHEPVGREAGLTTDQLAVIRDLAKPLPTPSNPGVLSPVQAAALQYADTMTMEVKVPRRLVDSLRTQLEISQIPSAAGVTVEQQLLEATATASAYNMVSRLLLALDVADEADVTVPFPAAPSEEVQVATSDGLKLHVRVSQRAVGGPWILFVNSLMTNLSMWDGAAASLTRKYNVITYDQRGHGKVGVDIQCRHVGGPPRLIENSSSSACSRGFPSQPRRR
jgi:hypothetical protein